MKDYEFIRLNIEKGVATITFASPRTRNALGLQAMRETLHAFDHLEARDEVGAVVLTGEGEGFCAGFQLKEIPTEGDGIEAIRAHFREAAMWWHQLLHRIIRIPKPVLAAVNGVAAGSGLGMTLAADLAVCTESATFLCAWHSIGIANDAATSYTLAKIVGFRRAMELMLTNRSLGAREALEWGIVNRVYAAGEFAKNVAEIARELADAPTHLQAMAKERFHMGWNQGLEECTEFEIQNVLASVSHPHFKPCLEAFLAGNKRNVEQVRLP